MADGQRKRYLGDGVYVERDLDGFVVLEEVKKLISALSEFVHEAEADELTEPAAVENEG